MTNTILNRRGVPAGLFVSDPRTAEALAAKLAENGIDVVQQTHGAFGPTSFRTRTLRSLRPW